jgi:two-component system response regulator FixJ
MKLAYVVDDDAAFRDSMVMLLSANGWTVSAFESPQAFSARSAELEPGLLLLDLHMPGKSGLELLESELAEIDRFAVVMITGAGRIDTAVRTIRAGALDFIEKPFAGEELLARLDALDADLQATLGAKRTAIEARALVEALSAREREVLVRLVGGASNKWIARDLDISPRTVEMHRARMLQRLGVGTTADAVELAKRAGLRPVEVE